MRLIRWWWVLGLGCAAQDPSRPKPEDTGNDLPDLLDPTWSSTGGGTTTEAGWVWELPAGFPAPVVPADNPMTAEKVELGRHLFYDPRLSANGTQSCSSCHDQALGFADGRDLPVGSTGEVLPRNSMGLANTAWVATLTWANPVLQSLEQQVLVPMFAEFPVELGMTGHEARIYAEMLEDPTYLLLARDAFPELPPEERLTTETVVDSLACFLRSLISGDSPYDRYVYGGDDQAVSAAARRGLDLFLSERLECFHCHGTYLLSMNQVAAGMAFPEANFQNTGLYNLDGRGAYPEPNTGVHHVTGNDWDMGRFRPVSLRNVAVTAPYFHDGSAATLDEVLDHYARGGRLIESGPLAGDGALNPYKSGFVSGFELTERERADLLAFLESLTDPGFLSDPRHADPW